MIIMNAGSSYFEHVENYYGSNACEQNSCRNAEMPDGIVDNDGEMLYYKANKFSIEKCFHLLLF